MSNLLIFFAIPIAVIIFSIVFQKLLKCPLMVASVIFAILIVATFIINNLNFLVATIIYTILAFIVAFLTMVFCRLLQGNCRCRNGCNNGYSCDNGSNNGNNGNSLNTADLLTINSTCQNGDNGNLLTISSNDINGCNNDLLTINTNGNINSDDNECNCGCNNNCRAEYNIRGCRRRF